MKTALLGLKTEELCDLMRGEGVPAYRGKQVAEWIYQKGVHTFEEMTNLPPGLCARLKEKYEVGRSRVAAVQRSRDGTMKLLLEMRDGARVETVGLPYQERFSCCVSTQVGCPMGCVFCATGQSGFSRNLGAGEIVDQVLAVREAAREKLPDKDGSPISHVTFMGMGEPLLNYEATVKALSLLNKEMGIGARHLTVSTVGLVPAMQKLAKEKLQSTLAVSLHAPGDKLRRQLIPKAGEPVVNIINACRSYVRQTGRRVTFEYCLLGGVNDGEAEARELALILRGLNCHVNLIPYNGVSGLPFKASKNAKIFAEVLQKAGIPATVRVERGADIDAACGQLRRRLDKS